MCTKIDDLFILKAFQNIFLKNKLYILIYILFSNITYSQLAISLEKALEKAKIKNINLKIADKEIEKQNILKKSSFQTEPLQLQYQGGQFNSIAYDHNISIQQYFLIGKVTKTNREWQDELIKLVQKRKALTEYEIEKTVRLVYYQYLYGIVLKKLNSELYEIYNKFLSNAELRFKTGESGAIEMISAKAKVKEIETQKIQLDYDLLIYQKQFQYFIQTDEDIIPDTQTNLQYTPLNEANTKIDGLINDYYTQQINVYQKEANTFKSLRIPKLGLGYFGQTIDKKTYFQGFTAGLQIPLLGSINSNKAKALLNNISQSQLMLDKATLTLKLQKEQLLNEYEKQKEVVNYYQKEGMQYANQIITTAQKSYASGDMSYWSYISFLNQAIDLKKQNIEAIHAYNQSAIQYEFPYFFE